jgi:hypothetical protein
VDRVTDRLTIDQMTSDQLDELYDDLAEARQSAAAIAAQRDRLRQRMNTLADRWETALPGQPHHGFAKALRDEVSCAPFDPDGAMTVQEYTERGRKLWAFRCWGTDTCDGWLGLGHHTQTSALVERERHVVEAHVEETGQRHPAEAALARITALAEEHPVGIDTALIHEALATAEPAHDDGPSVRDCAADDRRWPLQKAGE